MCYVRVDCVHAAADLPTLNRAELEQLLHYAARHVHRDGEADADISAAAREDGGVDADQLAVQVDERKAVVALVDGGVGLEENLVSAEVDPRTRHATKVLLR